MEYFYCIQKETVGGVSNEILYIYKIDSNGNIYVPIWDNGLQCISTWPKYERGVHMPLYIYSKYVKSSLKEIQRLINSKKYRLYRWYG